MSGDARQAQPIGNEPMHRVGPYRGRGVNKPRKGQAPPDTPSLEGLTERGELFREEFQDVVILREVHRIERQADSLSDEEQRHYADEAEKFLEVTDRMADCCWTLQEHAWLARRNRSRLSLTEKGREELLAFVDAPLLMDGRKRRANGEDGAEQVNHRELNRLAAQTGVPILSCRAYHDKPTEEKNLRPELFDDEEFRGLSAALLLCIAARVLLTKNTWIEAGLMNGAMGYVRGFIWPRGGNPHSEFAPFRIAGPVLCSGRI